MRSSLTGSIVGLSYVLGASAQSWAWTDASTGIDFQRYYDSESGYSFGIALPETVGTDFIAQLVVPLTSSAGWGGVSLGGSMTGNLLFVAWADGEEIKTSFREATGYTTPPVYTGAAAAVPIANGTFINSTALSYTFLCSNCIAGNETFAASDTNPVLGYAVAATNPTTPSDESTALSYHGKAFGEYAISLTAAKSASYATWASWAQASTSTNGTGNSTTTTTGTNSTTTSTGSNSTTTVPATTLNSTYDYIVVGGGPAGLIAAERLAESGKSVLLLERGGAPTVSTGSKATLPWNDTITQYDLPAFGSSLLTASDTSEFCTDTASTAGCILGGSSSVNALNFIYPQERDFDDKWPTGWKWSDVSAAASRLYERNTGTTLPSLDGKRYDQSAFNIVSGFLKGLGWSQVDSIKSPNSKTKSFSQPAWSILNGKRAGPVRTYLPIAQALDNFSLRLNTKVTNVIRTGSKITGVLTIAADGSSQIININDGGKVVLAAGALSTPRILFNSGIGPSDQLSIVNSGTSGVVLPDESDWINLPVGHNLKDHPQWVLLFNSKTNFTAYNWSSIETSPSQVDQDLYAQGSGTLVQAGQRLHLWTSQAEGLDGAERFFQGTVSSVTSGIVRIKAFLTHGATSSGVLGITADGTTTIKTAPWLTTAADKAAATWFLQYLIDGSTSDNSTITFQGASNASSVIDSHVTGDHWVGTAKIGSDSGLVSGGTSVVDLDTKVYGTDNLFVVDASIHPDLPTGNTQAIIMVVSEAAAVKIAAASVSSSNTTSSSNSTGLGNGLSSNSTSTSTSPSTISLNSTTVVNATTSSSTTASACHLAVVTVTV